jgi:hypothetical protein
MLGLCCLLLSQVLEREKRLSLCTAACIMQRGRLNFSICQRSSHSTPSDGMEEVSDRNSTIDGNSTLDHFNEAGTKWEAQGITAALCSP